MYFFKLIIFIITLLFPLKIFSIMFYLNNYSSRAISMGASFVSIKGDIDSIIANPSFLSQIDYNKFQYTYANFFGFDIVLNNFGYILPFGEKNGAIGINYTVVDSGNQPVIDINRYSEYGGDTGEGMIFSGDDEPYILGYFSEARSALYISYGRYVYKKIALGINIKRFAYFYSGDNIDNKYLNALIHTSANCWSFDLGVSYNDLIKNLSIGASLMDFINTGFDWNTEEPYSEAIDKSFSVGISYTIIKNLLLSLEYDRNLTAKQNYLKFGAEYNLLSFIPFRAGYNNGNISFGGGIIIKSNNILNFLNYNKNILMDKILKIDYALTLNSNLGDTHRFTVGLNF